MAQREFETMVGDATVGLGDEPTVTRPALAGDIDTEVCVVGGGVAGLTVARELARRGFGTVMLEARAVCAGASAYSAGIVAPGFSATMDRVLDRVGRESARELWTLSKAGADYIRRAIAEAQIKGTKPVPGRLSINKIDDEAGARRAAERYRRMFGTKTEFWPTARVRATLSSQQYFQGVFDYGAFHIHTRNYVRGLAEAAELAGVRIFEQSPALGLDIEGVRKRVVTAAGRVRATQIVIAAGCDVENVYPQLAGTSMKTVLSVAVTQPIANLSDAVRFRGAVVHRNRAAESYYAVADRLIWRAPVSLRGALIHAREQVRRDITSLYPQLSVPIDRVWSAPVTSAIHHMPQVGPLAPGVWLAAAFGHHGLAAASMGAEMIARAIHEGDDRWRLLSDFGLVWAGGRFGRFVIGAATSAARSRDSLREAVSRARDRRRSRPRVLQEPRVKEDATGSRAAP